MEGTGLQGGQVNGFLIPPYSNVAFNHTPIKYWTLLQHIYAANLLNYRFFWIPQYFIMFKRYSFNKRKRSKDFVWNAPISELSEAQITCQNTMILERINRFRLIIESVYWFKSLKVLLIAWNNWPFIFLMIIICLRSRFIDCILNFHSFSSHSLWSRVLWRVV